MSQEIQIDGTTYSISKLNALRQFHVVRRLAPIMATLGINFSKLKTMDSPEQMAELLQPFAEMLAKMPDEEANYVIMNCLSVVGKSSAGRFAPLVSPDLSSLMFQDIEMPVMIRLVVEVVRFNFMGFFDQLGGMIDSPST